MQAAFDSLVKFGVPPKPATEDAPPESVQLDLYQEQVVFVRDALRQFVENPSENKQLVTRLSTAKVSVQSIINGQEDPNIRPFLNKVLMPPLETASSAVSGAVGGELNQGWCSEVSDPFKRNLFNRYPFNKTGHDAALQDVADFYRPSSGTVWSFFDASLKDNVRKVDSTYKAFRGVGNVSFSRPCSPSCRARMTSPPRCSRPRARIPGCSSPSTSGPRRAGLHHLLGGRQDREYKNGPEEWYPFTWPGTARSPGPSSRCATTAARWRRSIKMASGACSG